MITEQLSELVDLIDSSSALQEKDTLRKIKERIISIIEQAEAFDEELSRLRSENNKLIAHQTAIIEGFEATVNKSKVDSACLRLLTEIHQHFNPIKEHLNAKEVSRVTNKDETFVEVQISKLEREGYLHLEVVDFDYDSPYIHLTQKGASWLIENGIIKENF
jgi:hypothetical protein